MQTKVKLLGHPVHQMLIVFPLGLLATAVLFDLVHIASGRPMMAAVAYWMMVAGIIGGLLAAPFGWLDWMQIPRGTRAKRVGLVHGLGNVGVVLLFIGSWWLRRETPEAPAALAHALSFIGAGIAMVTAWLGGELVDRLGVGVYDDANLDAPTSLREPKLRERPITR
ncbi:MAG: DUF2231 domain-containing protein [Pseudomonadota bacterium]